MDLLEEASYPSPADSDALAWASVDEASQRRCCAGARALSGFVRDHALTLGTPKRDERTNVIDVGERATYCYPPETLSRLFQHLEACRLEGSTTHFSERQGTAAAPLSGLMLDYDLVVSHKKPAMVDRHFFRVAGALAGALQRDIDFAAQLPALPSGARPVETRFHMFFIVRPAASPVPISEAAAGEPPQPRYKYGFHVLVPGAQLGRAYKKWFLKSFKADPAVALTLRELGVVGDPEACLDQNSASVPVHFFGSCKRGAVPYTLGAALEVTLDLAAGGSGFVPQPVIRRLDEAYLAGFNLVAELSLVAPAEYGDDRAPLVVKRGFEPRPSVAAAVGDWAARAECAGGRAEELEGAENSLSTLTLHDPDARLVHMVLGLLGGAFLTERNRWRDVVYALAHTSEKYKPLAAWFSLKCLHRTRPGSRIDDLDALWNEAVARAASWPESGSAPLTLGSLKAWARDADPAGYAAVMERSYFTILLGFVYGNGGRLQHFMVAKLLKAMLDAKFCVDVEPGGRGGREVYCWYEFVLPGQPMRPGEVWKWRREAEPDDIHIYMSEKLPRVFDQVAEHIDEKRAGASNEDQALYYKKLASAFAASRVNLYNDTFKNGVVRQAHYLFRRRGFSEMLDRLPYLLGVSNGVLRIGPRCELINYFHEYPVCMFTPVAWRPFDASNPMTRLVLNAIADIIVEPDARDFILFHACQGVSGEEKEGIMLMWEGGGQNGKTSFLRWTAKALGPKADKFNIQLMSSQREEADRPNSAMMRFKHLNWAYAEETNRAQALNVARMKEMVNAGEVSGRDLNSKQETFTIRANLVAASQYSFIVNTQDHGTWRRLAHYTSKARFRRDPDPTNPYEKQDNQQFVREYPSDPEFRSSMISILTHYYERLQKEYNGQLKNVRSPTIERETEIFRLSQDTLHRWICESIVLSPDNETEYSASTLSSNYSDWYANHIERRKQPAVDVIKELESSLLSKYLKPAPNHTLILKGCRILTADTIGLRPGEEYISDAARSLALKAVIDTKVVLPPAREEWWNPPAAPVEASVGKKKPSLLVAGTADPVDPEDAWLRDAVGGVSGALTRADLGLPSATEGPRSSKAELGDEFDLEGFLGDWSGVGREGLDSGSTYVIEDVYG
jgi:phage/plasmid-associated DNA primase